MGAPPTIGERPRGAKPVGRRKRWSATEDRIPEEELEWKSRSLSLVNSGGDSEETARKEVKRRKDTPWRKVERTHLWGSRGLTRGGVEDLPVGESGGFTCGGARGLVWKEAGGLCTRAQWASDALATLHNGSAPRQEKVRLYRQSHWGRSG